VFSGLLALWHVPTDHRELAAGRAGGSAYILRLDSGWYGPERNAKHVWAWTADTATLAVESWPRQGPTLRIRVGLRALSPRTVEVRDAQRVLWHGIVGTQTQFVVIPDVPRGPTKLEFTTNAPPIKEGPQPSARGLGLAVSDPRLD
ncbi:MAG: hypothetical protein ACRDL8_03680, partial [Solirubrobacteraceae bacterium]